MQTGQTVIATVNQPAITADDILSDADGQPICQWSDYSSIVNKVDIKFDFNDPALVKDDHARRRVYVADRSKADYLQQMPVTHELRGVRTVYAAQALTDAMILTYFQRWGVPPPALRLSLRYAMHLLEPGDRIPVTHPLIENKLTGQIGLRNEWFEVVSISPFWVLDGHVEAVLLWVGAIETSPVPTSTLVNLVPGIATLDGTDIPVPLSGSATFTTASGIKSLRVGLKAVAQRAWRCTFAVQHLEGPKGGGGSCQPAGTVDLYNTYRGSWTYRMEYKTTGAPDAAGSGGNPTTGWVELLASKTVGGVALYGAGGCGGGMPGLPPEEAWTEFFETLGGSPATYNVKVFWTAVGTASSPCSGYDPDVCNVDIFCDGTGTLAGSTLDVDNKSFTIDYQEGLT